MFKKKNMPILIVSGLLLALAIVIIVLSFVQNTFLNRVQGFSYIKIYNPTETTVAREIGSNESTRSDFNDIVDAMGKTNFSTMQGILEGKWNIKPHFLRDDDDDKIETKQNELNNYTSSTGQYLLEFNWGIGNLQSIVVEGATIKYDMMKFAIGNSDGEVAEIVVYAYQYNDFEGSPIDMEDRHVNPFYVYMNTTELYKTVNSIVSD